MYRVQGVDAMRMCCRSGEPPGFPYGERVVFMANDWHAALVPAYLGGKYRRHGVYQEARSLFAIHNLSHQGVEKAEQYGDLGLPGDWCACQLPVATLACSAACCLA